MMATWGIDESEFADVPLWLENVPAFNFFVGLANQWRVGGAGAYALDYNVVFHELDRMGLGRDEYDDLLEDVRVMERAAPEAMKD